MSRFKCHSDLYEMDLMLDVNISIYPLKVQPLHTPSYGQTSVNSFMHCCRSARSSR